MKTILWSTLWFCLLVFSGCSRQETDSVQPFDAASIIGKWTLSNPQTNYKITLQIAQKSVEGTVTQYQLTGLAPVNQYGTVATVQADGAAVLENVVTTKRGGPQEAMDAEMAYYNSLEQVNRIEIVGGKLQLRSGDTKWSRLVYNKEL